jgi:hypothetical protein
MTTSNGFAGRDDFLAATKRRFKECPLWGGKKCRIRSLTAAEYAEIDAKNIDFRKGGLSANGVRNSNLRLIIASVCDANGEPVFMESDLEKLANIDVAMVEPLVKEIKEHCGLRQDVEAALKNLEATAGGDSPSSSAAPLPTT